MGGRPNEGRKGQRQSQLTQTKAIERISFFLLECLGQVPGCRAKKDAVQALVFEVDLHEAHAHATPQFCSSRIMRQFMDHVAKCIKHTAFPYSSQFPLP